MAFPHTALTIGDPAKHASAPQTGDGSIFFLPLDADKAKDINGNQFVGISVQVLAMPLAQTGGAAPLATLIGTSPGGPLDVDMLSATVRVSVGYRENQKSTGHQNSGKGTDGAGSFVKFVTVTAQVVQNESH